MKHKKTNPASYVRMHITLSDYMKAKAQAEADILFAGNISAYIAYLIQTAETTSKPLTLSDIQPMQFDGIEGELPKRKPGKKTTPTA